MEPTRPPGVPGNKPPALPPNIDDETISRMVREHFGENNKEWMDDPDNPRQPNYQGGAGEQVEDDGHLGDD